MDPEMNAFASEADNQGAQNPGREGFERYWREFSFFRGYLAKDELERVRQYAVVDKDVDGEHRFYLLKKSDLRSTRAMKPAHNPNKCFTWCFRHPKCRRDCTRAHVVDGVDEARSRLGPPAQSRIFVSVPGKQSQTISVEVTKDLEPTAGLLFTSRLLQDGIIEACQPTVCAAFLNKGACRNGERCLCIHLRALPEKERSIGNLWDAATPLTEALAHFMERERGLRAFVEGNLAALGIRTVGDAQLVSPTAFENFSRVADKKQKVFWMLLHNLRTFDEEFPTEIAVSMFPGMEHAPRIPDTISTIKRLVDLRSRALYSLPLPVSVLDVLERIRTRMDPGANEHAMYSLVTLSEQEPWSFFNIMARKVCEFRFTHAHQSWRKQDATRPIVTSLITYVDASACSCRQAALRPIGGTPQLGSITTSPIKRPSVNGSAAHPQRQRSASEGHDGPSSGDEPQTTTPSPNSSESPGPAAPAAQNDGGPQQPQLQELHPISSWCSCTRSYELAVNYELSTPSGSRCSEQNCLGRLASMGLPTHSIREVFVHGGKHNEEDPNPLFPCGVCENMFRRVSKDVMKKHAGDVMLYMFDAVERPKKLVCIPISEISLRAGSGFRRFVEEDLRDD